MTIYRARIVASHGPNLKDVVIPALYKQAVLPKIRSGVDANTGENVLVAKLATNPRLSDWQVIGWEDEVGRAWEPADHDHPISQVDGLEARLKGIEDRLDAAGL